MMHDGNKNLNISQVAAVSGDTLIESLPLSQCHLFGSLKAVLSTVHSHRDEKLQCGK
jgi:hypothetical protein